MGYYEKFGLRTAPVKFRLSDIYTYSQARMDRAIQATG